MKLRAFLLAESMIDANSVHAYRETEYRVYGEQPFTMKVDDLCPELEVAHRRHGVNCSAYLTACNPYSQLLTDKSNAERHAALGRSIGLDRRMAIEGAGQHPSNQWPGEASYLIFGLTLEAATTFGKQLEQNAFI